MLLKEKLVLNCLLIHRNSTCLLVVFPCRLVLPFHNHSAGGNRTVSELFFAVMHTECEQVVIHIKAAVTSLESDGAFLPHSLAPSPPLLAVEALRLLELGLW